MIKLSYKHILNSQMTHVGYFIPLRLPACGKDTPHIPVSLYGPFICRLPILSFIVVIRVVFIMFLHHPPRCLQLMHVIAQRSHEHVLACHTYLIFPSLLPGSLLEKLMKFIQLAAQLATEFGHSLNSIRIQIKHGFY